MPNWKDRESRKGKVGLSVYITPQQKKKLAYLCVDEGKTQQDLLVEGLNMVFESREGLDRRADAR